MCLAEGELAVGLGIKVYDCECLANCESASWELLTLTVWERSAIVFENQLPDVGVRYFDWGEAFDRHICGLRTGRSRAVENSGQYLYEVFETIPNDIVQDLFGRMGIRKAAKFKRAQPGQS